MRLDFQELEALKIRVAGQYDASPGGDLEGIMADCRQALEGRELFTDVVVRKTGSQLQQIEAACRLARPNTPEETVAEELERIWENDLRYDDFAAHALGRNGSTLVLDFLTVTKSARLYVTGMVVVQLVTRDA